jgi:hypothetical protein
MGNPRRFASDADRRQQAEKALAAMEAAAREAGVLDAEGLATDDPIVQDHLRRRVETEEARVSWLEPRWWECLPRGGPERDAEWLAGRDRVKAARAAASASREAELEAAIRPLEVAP